MKLTLILSLLSSLAFAQVGICKAGAPCAVRLLKTTGGSSAQAPICLTTNGGSYNIGLVATGALVWNLRLYSDASCRTAAADIYSYDLGSSLLTVVGRVQVAAGTAALPSLSLTADPNTGLYSVGADQLGVATAGVRSFSFDSIAGVLMGTTSATYLQANGSGAGIYNGSRYFNCDGTSCKVEVPAGFFDVNGNLRRTSGRSSVTVEDGDGLSIVGTATTGFPATGASEQGLLLADSQTGRIYHRPSTTIANAPPFDLGGFPHPVLQRHLYGIDMGMESTATPTFYPVAPRIGGSAATVTVVDAAAATAVNLGSSPYIFGARGSVTAAAAGSISSLITSAYIRAAGRAPRWCQKLALSSGSDIRVWAGIASALPGSSDSPATSYAAFRYSTAAGDTKYQACRDNGIGAPTCTDTGVAPNLSGFETLCIDCREGGTTACTFWINGAAVVRATTGLGAGYPFAPFYSVEALAAVAKTLWAGDVSVEVN